MQLPKEFDRLTASGRSVASDSSDSSAASDVTIAVEIPDSISQLSARLIEHHNLNQGNSPASAASYPSGISYAAAPLCAPTPSYPATPYVATLSHAPKPQYRQAPHSGGPRASAAHPQSSSAAFDQLKLPPSTSAEFYAVSPPVQRFVASKSKLPAYDPWNFSQLSGSIPSIGSTAYPGSFTSASSASTSNRAGDALAWQSPHGPPDRASDFLTSAASQTEKADPWLVYSPVKASSGVLARPSAPAANPHLDTVTSVRFATLLKAMQHVAKVLRKAEVPYAVLGGMAIRMLGDQDRETQDVDCAVDADARTLHCILEAAGNFHFEIGGTTSVLKASLNVDRQEVKIELLLAHDRQELVGVPISADTVCTKSNIAVYNAPALLKLKLETFYSRRQAQDARDIAYLWHVFGNQMEQLSSSHLRQAAWYFSTATSALQKESDRVAFRQKLCPDYVPGQLTKPLRNAFSIDSRDGPEQGESGALSAAGFSGFGGSAVALVDRRNPRSLFPPSSSSSSPFKF